MGGSGEPRKASGRVSARALKQRLESLADAGIADLPRASSRAARKAPAAGQSAMKASGQASGKAASPAPAREQLLEVIRGEVAACVRCEQLACTRTNTVFGTGPATARLCFFGEAPGADEDASGIPFVGRAGQLLTKIIEACTLSRDEV